MLTFHSQVLPKTQRALYSLLVLEDVNGTETKKTDIECHRVSNAYYCTQSSRPLFAAAPARGEDKSKLLEAKANVASELSRSDVKRALNVGPSALRPQRLTKINSRLCEASDVQTPCSPSE